MIGSKRVQRSLRIEALMDEGRWREALAQMDHEYFRWAEEPVPSERTPLPTRDLSPELLEARTPRSQRRSLARRLAAEACRESARGEVESARRRRQQALALLRGAELALCDGFVRDAAQEGDLVAARAWLEHAVRGRREWESLSGEWGNYDFLLLPYFFPALEAQRHTGEDLLQRAARELAYFQSASAPRDLGLCASAHALTILVDEPFSPRASALELALEAYRAAGDAHGEAHALHFLSRAQRRITPAKVRPLLEQLLTLARRAKLPFYEGHALLALARLEEPGELSDRALDAPCRVWRTTGLGFLAHKHARGPAVLPF